MKKMIAKTLFTVLCLGSISAHAGLAQTLGSGTRTVLQKIGENSGWTTYIGVALLMMYGRVNHYRVLCKHKNEYKNAYYEGSYNQENLNVASKDLWQGPFILTGLALAGICLSKTALWASKKI